MLNIIAYFLGRSDDFHGTGAFHIACAAGKMARCIIHDPNPQAISHHLCMKIQSRSSDKKSKLNSDILVGIAILNITYLYL